MPLYEFYCYDCDERVEELRKMGDYTSPDCGFCGGGMSHIVSVPTMHVWDGGREFDNVGADAMTFATKGDYEMHLKENHIAEVSTDAPIETPHGSTILKT